MKLSTAFCLALVCLFLFSSQVHAQGTTVWISGTIADQPTEAYYGVVCDQFSFSVANSSDSNLFLPSNVTVIAAKGLLDTTELVMDANLNLTGTFAMDQPNPQSPPVGFFVASYVNRNITSEDWRTALTALINDVAQIGRLLVTLVVELVKGITGYALPGYTVGAIMVFLAISFVIRFFNKLPKLIVLLVAIISVAVLLYVLSPYFL